MGYNSLFYLKIRFYCRERLKLLNIVSLFRDWLVNVLICLGGEGKCLPIEIVFSVANSS